jgi:hypothetical protein
MGNSNDDISSEDHIENLKKNQYIYFCPNILILSLDPVPLTVLGICKSLTDT